MTETSFKFKRSTISSDRLDMIPFFLIISTFFFSIFSVLLNFLILGSLFQCFEDENKNVQITKLPYFRCYQIYSDNPLYMIFLVVFVDSCALFIVMFGASPNFKTKSEFKDKVKKRNKFYIKFILIKIICIIVYLIKLCFLSWVLVTSRNSNDTQWITKQDCHIRNILFPECIDSMSSISKSTNSILNMTYCELKEKYYKEVCVVTRSKILPAIHWFWVIIVLTFLLYSLARVIGRLTKQSRMKFIKKYLIRHDIEIDGSNKEMLNSFVFQYLKQDGVLMLRIAVFCLINGEELIFELWDEYKSGDQSMQIYNDIDL